MDNWLFNKISYDLSGGVNPISHPTRIFTKQCTQTQDIVKTAGSLKFTFARFIFECEMQQYEWPEEYDVTKEDCWIMKLQYL